MSTALKTRAEWPLWAKCYFVGFIGLGCLALGFFLRTTTPDETSKTRATAALAMSTAFDLLKDKGEPSAPQHFTTQQPFSESGSPVGFTIQKLEASTYLVLSDDQKIMLLLQQQPDGTQRKCLMHPPEIQAGSCQLGR